MNNIEAENISDKEGMGDVTYGDWDLSLVTSLSDDSVVTPSSSDWDLSKTKH